MKVSGTSSMHDWSMKTNTMTSESMMTTSGENLTALSSLRFSLKSTDLKSDKKGLDKNAYKALKAEQFNDITFTLTASKVLTKEANSFPISTEGNLTIAGTTKKVAIDVFCHVNTDVSITCIGNHGLKMSYYGMKPPVFMMGAMKTGDDLEVNFTITYLKDKQ